MGPPAPGGARRPRDGPDARHLDQAGQGVGADGGDVAIDLDPALGGGAPRRQQAWAAGGRLPRARSAPSISPSFEHASAAARQHRVGRAALVEPTWRIETMLDRAWPQPGQEVARCAGIAARRRRRGRPGSSNSSARPARVGAPSCGQARQGRAGRRDGGSTALQAGQLLGERRGGAGGVGQGGGGQGRRRRRRGPAAGRSRAPTTRPSSWPSSSDGRGRR